MPQFGSTRAGKGECTVASDVSASAGTLAI